MFIVKIDLIKGSNEDENIQNYCSVLRDMESNGFKLLDRFTFISNKNAVDCIVDIQKISSKKLFRKCDIYRIQEKIDIMPAVNLI